jgi:hypothetical protein
MSDDVQAVPEDGCAISEDEWLLDLHKNASMISQSTVVKELT